MFLTDTWQDTMFGSEPEHVGDARSREQAIMGNYAQERFGNTMYPIAPTPQRPQAQGYNARGYGVPSQYNVPGAVGPTSDWFNNMSPEVMAGIEAPFKRGEQNLMETLGGGMGGTAGFSGMGAGALGRYWADAAPQIGQQAWGMTAPGLMQQSQNQLGANQNMWNAQLGANQWNAGQINQANQWNAGQDNMMAGMGYGGELQRMQNMQRGYQDPFNYYATTYGSPMIQPGNQGAIQTGLEGAMSALPFMFM